MIGIGRLLKGLPVPIDNPMETLKRNAIILILGVMALGGIFVTFIHGFSAETHPISLVLPPLTSIACLSLFLFLIKHPQKIYEIIKITLGWISFIILFPEYFFVIEAVLDDQKRLVDILPPISSGLFLLTTGMIVCLRPQGLVKRSFLLWLVTAVPIVGYLIFHSEELETPRGMDLIIALVPAMGINLALIAFYSQLQDAIEKLHIERFHLKEVSEKDPLTNVFNRRAGEEILQNFIEQPERKVGIILCDIDRFKQINDNYGHLLGDLVLQVIVQCCQAHLQNKDTIIRWGGEEFLIVVPEDDETELANLAERLRRAIANQPIPEVDKVTASFGIAFLQPQENLIQLFARADRALYQAKELGRNQVVLASTQTGLRQLS